ncbi:MAG TPA: hypothetical protein VLT62_08025 [Candidatus Methylomirabilis sp.]|nr:hypothetical protein [Candidatus Methylomirabilis sp.]
MALILKCLLGLFILIGLLILSYSLLEIWHTRSIVQISTGRAKAVFAAYEREWVKSISSTPSPADPGRYDFQESWSVLSYPQFEYRARDGQLRTVRDPKIHLMERLKPGEEVEILVFQYWEPRLADDYSLYGRDIAIAVFGLLFLLVPLLIWRVAVPSLSSPAGAAFSQKIKEASQELVQTRVGPVSVRFILEAVAIFILFVVLVSLAFSAKPFIHQLIPGSSNPLINSN